MSGVTYSPPASQAQIDALAAQIKEQELMASERDTAGGVVSMWKPHTYTRDASGNLATDTVTDGSATWVRTFTWSNGAQTADSGWVKQ